LGKDNTVPSSDGGDSFSDGRGVGCCRESYFGTDSEHVACLGNSIRNRVTGYVGTRGEGYLEISDDVDMKWFQPANLSGELRMGEQQWSLERGSELCSGGQGVDVNGISDHYFISADEKLTGQKEGVRSGGPGRD
jgi:hypothetical protein